MLLLQTLVFFLALFFSGIFVEAIISEYVEYKETQTYSFCFFVISTIFWSVLFYLKNN